MSAVWDSPCKTHTQKLVLLALADNANDSGSCWPGIDYLAAKCEMSRQGIMDQISSLENSGLLKVDRKIGAANRYNVTMKPVNRVDGSTALTGQPGGLPPVNAVDPHQSTVLAPPVNRVDPNHHEPSDEPSIEPSLVELPENLQTAVFLTTWELWKKHRKEIKKPLKPTTEKMQLKKMSEFGLVRAVAALEFSIMQGYEGIFEPRYQPSDKSTPPSGRTATQIIMGMGNKRQSEMTPEELAAFSECLR